VSEQPAVTAGPIHVVHRTRHRFRLKLSPEDRSPARMAALRARLESTPGVVGTQVNPQTGSILVQHEGNVLLEDLLERAGLTENVLVDAFPPRLREQVRSEASQVAQGLADFFFQADAELSRATGGWLDLKMTIPLGLLGAGVWRLAAEGAGILEVPPYLLLWWSFDTFVKLHQPQIERTEVPAEQVGRAARLRPKPMTEP
jgi:hypothetical protein